MREAAGGVASASRRVRAQPPHLSWVRAASERGSLCYGMSAHAANSRLAASFSVQTHTSARSPLVETGDAAENSGYSGKRDGSVIGPRDPLASAPCNGGRTSAPPCSATTANSAKSLSPSSAASASDYTVSKNGHTSAVSAHHSSASSDSNAITSYKSKDANNSECSSGGVSVYASARSHNLSSLGERSSPASARRSDGGTSRESRMDAANFRLRLRKGGGEGVTKKGPLVSETFCVDDMHVFCATN